MPARHQRPFAGTPDSDSADSAARNRPCQQCHARLHVDSAGAADAEAAYTIPTSRTASASGDGVNCSSARAFAAS